MMLHVLSLLSAASLPGGVDAGPGEQCTCAVNREVGGWCDVCHVGYVAAVRIDSKPFFEALDAHGHSIRPASIRCAGCRKALKQDGFCHKCHVGFVDGEAYFSKLTYLLARGIVTPSASIDCPQCRMHLKHPGWCDKCQRGMVGFAAYRDKQLFAQAARARAVLRESIEMIPECLSCAIAKAVDRKCRKCGKSFENGEVVSSVTAQRSYATSAVAPP